MTTLDLERIELVHALDVPPGAVLVLRSAQRLTKEQAEMAQKSVEEVLPGRPVLVLGGGWDITVVRDEGSTNGTST